MKPRSTPPHATSPGSRLPKLLTASTLTLCAGAFALHGAATLISGESDPGTGLEQESPSPSSTTQDEKALQSSVTTKNDEEEAARAGASPQNAPASANALPQQEGAKPEAGKSSNMQEVNLVHHTKAQVMPVVSRVYHPAGRTIAITTAKGVFVRRQPCPQCGKHHDKGFWEEVVTGHETKGCSACGKEHDGDFTEEVPVEKSKAGGRKG